MERVAAALAARNRSAAGPTAPPDGLCLTGCAIRSIRSAIAPPQQHQPEATAIHRDNPD